MWLDRRSLLINGVEPMSFSEDYTTFKINELKELNAHPEQKDAKYDVNGSNFKDHGPTNTALMTITIAPLIFFCLGVIFAPARYHPEEPVEAPAEVAAEAVPALEEQKPAVIKEAGAPVENAAPAAQAE
jgi:hypothetical protein